MSAKPSCFVIGNTSLAIKCIELMLSNKWELLGVISADEKVIEYVQKKNIPIETKTSLLEDFVAQKSFDYLFSIVNEIIINKTTLELANKLSINYHDSLLPKGAGVFSTTWAIINQDKEHGITWHVIAPKIDTGSILLQTKIEIAADERTMSLNTKCYECAIESFASLLHQLEHDAIEPKPQDVANRTYKSLYKRPDNIGLLNLLNDKSQIDSLLRALDFGSGYNNNFCSAKIGIGGEFFIIKSYSWIATTTNNEAGSMELINSNEIVINVKGGKLKVQELLNINGEAVSFNSLITNFDLKPGSVIYNSIKDEHNELVHLYERTVFHEGFWVHKLANLNLVKFPFISTEERYCDRSNYAVSEFKLDTQIPIRFNELGNPNHGLLSTLLLFVAKLLDSTHFDIWLMVKPDYRRFENLFSPLVPLQCEVDKSENVLRNILLINEQVEETILKQTFTRDVFHRYRKLEELAVKSLVKKIPFFIGYNHEDKDFIPSFSFEWGILVSPLTNSIKIVFHENNRYLKDKFCQHLSTFIQNAFDKNNSALKDIALLTVDEQRLKLMEWNKQKVDYPKNSCVHELIEKWALEKPNEIAVVLKDEKIKYSELDHSANRIAQYLTANGIKPNDKVGVLMDRSINSIVSFYGIMKSGATYVPFDISNPEERLKYLIRDSKVKTLLVDSETIVPNGEGVDIIFFKQIPTFTLSDKPVVQGINASQLAYIKYTSGSTGFPKGVMITHQNVVAFLYSYQQVVNLKERRIGTCVAPLNFDVSVEEIYACLCFGGTVHIMMKDQTTDLEYFADYLVKNRINVSYIFPEFIDGIGKQLKKSKEVYLKTLITGLHSKKNKIFKSFFELGSAVSVINSYGPTEVTYGSSAYVLNGLENPNENTPIGKPFPNYQTYILNSSMQVQPDYVLGELYIGGVGLAAGYVGKPELTAKTFVAFKNQEINTLVYKTGDMVYSLPNGDIQIVRRNDDQVKINGYRIEINEIVEAFKSNKYVESCVVTKYTVTGHHDQLISYLTLTEKTDHPEQVIREYVKTRIPEYMIPSFIIFLDKIPQFPNGKVNISLLPKPNNNRNVAIITPETVEEEKVKKIFEEHLSIQPISVNENFFSLGGDSLSAVHVMQEIENQFDIKIPISKLYQYPSVKALSDYMRKSSTDLIIPIRKTGDQAPVFFIHGMNGELYSYRFLFDKIKKEHPVYGIHSDYPDDIESEHFSIASIAKSYVEQILNTMHPDSLVLVGFSFGGMIGLEMAKQLKEKGVAVKLILLDTNFRRIFKRLNPGIYMSIRILGELKRLLNELFEVFALLLLKQKFKEGFVLIKAMLFRFLFFTRSRSKVNNPTRTDARPMDNNQKSKVLASKYNPSIYSGEVCLIQAGEKVGNGNLKIAKTNFLKWFVTGAIHIKQTDISHSDLIKDENSITVAALINSFL